MSDSSTPGQRLDAQLAELRTAFEALRDELEVRAGDLADDVVARIDAVSAQLDEVQAAWDNRDT